MHRQLYLRSSLRKVCAVGVRDSYRSLKVAGSTGSLGRTYLPLDSRSEQFCSPVVLAWVSHLDGDAGTLASQFQIPTSGSEYVSERSSFRKSSWHHQTTHRYDFARSSTLFSYPQLVFLCFRHVHSPPFLVGITDFCIMTRTVPCSFVFPLLLFFFSVCAKRSRLSHTHFKRAARRDALISVLCAAYRSRFCLL